MVKAVGDYPMNDRPKFGEPNRPDHVKILFDLVYRWGQAGYKADRNTKSFRDALQKAMEQVQKTGI